MIRRKKVLGISASPRKKGNSNILLDSALAGASSAGAGVDKISLNDLEFVPCRECARVRRDGVCRIKDGMRVVYEKIEEADAVALATPVFFGSVSAQAKMMIDRYQCLWLAKYVFGKIKLEKRKKGAFLCVSASARRDFFRAASSVARNFFAAIGASYDGEVFCPSVSRKGDILSKKKCLRKAREIGEKLAR